MAEAKKVEKSVGVLQYALSSLAPGVLVGIVSGSIQGVLVNVCCCIMGFPVFIQIPTGFLSGVLLRLQKGAPLTLKEGAIVGLTGGLVGGIVHTTTIVVLSAFLNKGEGVGVAVVISAFNGVLGAALAIPVGVVFGAIGGLLFALESELKKR